MEKGIFLVLAIVGTIYVSEIISADICSGVPEDEIVVFPHVNCSKYWLCANGTTVELECPPGLWFNPKVESCDWPENSNCVPVDERCLGNITDYFPHPTDCHKYIECHNNTSNEMECPPGLWFDSELKLCRDPEDAICGDNGNNTTPPSNVTVTPTDTPYPTDETTLPSNVTVTPPSNVTVSPTDTPYPTDETTLPSNVTVTPPSNVTVSPTHTPYPTDETTLPSNVTVTPPSNVTVSPTDTPYTTDGTTLPSNITVTPPSNITVTPPSSSTVTPWIDPACEGVLPDHTEWRPYEGDCTKFWECTSYSSTVLDCPDGLYFNDEIKECDFPENSGCTNDLFGINPEFDNNCRNGEVIFWNDPKNCKQYMACVDGIVEKLTCGDGLFWEQSLEACVDPEDAMCPEALETLYLFQYD